MTNDVCERHREKAATQQPGQRWETLIDGTSTWVPCGEGGPLWDRSQDYRLMQEQRA